MAGLLDYLRWRGDLSYKQAEFNSCDAGLLATIAYWPFEKEDVGHSLRHAAKRMKQTKEFKEKLGQETREEIELVILSSRIGDMRLLDWHTQKRANPALQFAAMTVRMSKHKIVVSFRGTDWSMIGLQEDMAMSYTDEIYGQEVAADYLRDIAHRFPFDKIYSVGHSKGGNYACYSVGACGKRIQDRVIQAISFDGPGFTKQVYEAPAFKRAIPKMKTYVPESSLFGIMLDHPDHTLVVKSTYPMPHQHNPRHWSIGRDRFVLAKGLTRSAQVIRHSLIQFNHTIPGKDREEMWSALFSIFEDMDITDANQITGNKLTGTVKLTKAYIALPPRLRTITVQIVTDIFNSMRTSSKFAGSSGNDSFKKPLFNDSYSE